MRLVVRDKYWSVDGGVQGASTFATWEVKAPSGAIGSNAPAGNSAIAGLLGQTVNVRHESSTLSSTTGCLDVQWGKAANGQNVQTWECNDTKAQDWRLEQRTTGGQVGRYRLVSGLGDGSTYCLDNRGDYYDSARMGIWSCVGDDHSCGGEPDLRPGAGWRPGRRLDAHVHPRQREHGAVGGAQRQQGGRQRRPAGRRQRVACRVADWLAIQPAAAEGGVSGWHFRGGHERYRSRRRPACLHGVCGPSP